MRSDQTTAVSTVVVFVLKFFYLKKNSIPCPWIEHNNLIGVAIKIQKENIFKVNLEKSIAKVIFKVVLLFIFRRLYQ